MTKEPASAFILAVTLGCLPKRRLGAHKWSWLNILVIWWNNSLMKTDGCITNKKRKKCNLFPCFCFCSLKMPVTISYMVGTHSHHFLIHNCLLAKWNSQWWRKWKRPPIWAEPSASKAKNQCVWHEWITSICNASTLWDQIKKKGPVPTCQQPLVQDNDHQWAYPTELQLFKII